MGLGVVHGVSGKGLRALILLRVLVEKVLGLQSGLVCRLKQEVEFRFYQVEKASVGF